MKRGFASGSSGWRRTRCLLIAPLLALGTVSQLFAHALLIDSVPKADASLPAPPKLVLKFNSQIEARLSSVLLVGGPQNTRVVLFMSTRSITDTLIYSLPVLAPGQYRVEWKALSVDGHITDGVLRFTVIEAPR